MMTVFYTLLGILGALVYIIGGVIWFYIDLNESPLWLLILTTIFWPVVLVLGLVVLASIYLVGFILMFIFYLSKAIIGR
jgi:hypothetical protein